MILAKWKKEKVAVDTNENEQRIEKNINIKYCWESTKDTKEDYT